MREIVSYGSSKEAALYFDRVFPDDFLISLYVNRPRLNLAALEDQLVKFENYEETIRVFKSLLSIEEVKVKEIVDGYTANAALFVLATSIRDNRIPDFSIVPDDWIVDCLKKTDLTAAVSSRAELVQKADWTAKKLVEHRKSLQREIGFDPYRVWTNELLEIPKGKAEISGIAVTLKDLRLIDTTKVSWDAICEIRKDKVAMAELKKFRIFLTENFEGKEKEFISDKLSIISDSYERQAKIWGFETVTKAMTVALDHKSGLALGAAALSQAFTNLPLGIAATSAAVVPIGRAALEFARATIESSKTAAENPVKYLTRIQN